MFSYSSAPAKIKLWQSPMITSQILTVKFSAVPLKHCRIAGVWSSHLTLHWALLNPCCRCLQLEESWAKCSCHRLGRQTLEKRLFKRWLRHLGSQGSSSYLCLKTDRKEKSIMGMCKREWITGVQQSSRQTGSLTVCLGLSACNSERSFHCSSSFYLRSE